MTVKEYFMIPEHASIFSNSIITDLRQYSHYNQLTGSDVAAELSERFANLYINGEPTTAGFSRAVDIWHNSRKYYFDGLYSSTQFEYNPIHNTDVIETTESTRTPDLTREHTGEDEHSTLHGHKIVTEDESSGENDVTTYTSGTFLHDSQTSQTMDSTVTNSGTDKLTIETTKTETETGTETTESTITKVGNIGVTSTQEMIEQERRIRNLDIFEIWLERFAERFFIPIFKLEACF